MKNITFTANTVASLLGLSISYALCLYLFWISHRSGAYFTINPGHSHFTNLLDTFMHRDTARWFGIIGAFASVHVCWAIKKPFGYTVEKWFSNMFKKPEPVVRYKAASQSMDIISQSKVGTSSEEASINAQSSEHKQQPEQLKHHHLADNNVQKTKDFIEK